MTTPNTDWLERDAASVWHPFTQHSLWVDDRPLVVQRADGPWIYDTEGRRYLDGVSSWWVTTFGHGTPEINRAITDQLSNLDHFTFLGATHPPGIELAEELLQCAPIGDRRLSKVFYAGDGSSAVEAAVKMAYQYSVQTGRPRPRFVRLSQGYHGDTLGAVSMGGMDLFRATYRPLLLGTVEVTSPGLRRTGQRPAERAAEVATELGAVMAEQGDQVCAIIVEPLVQGAAGMLTYEPEFLRAARRIADQHNALLICDEVATGVGRTGRMWAVEHADVVPDLLVAGKGLTGGCLPLSATLATEDVYRAFLGTAQTRTFFHGHTYAANPLAAAAAAANLRLMAERGLVAQAARLGQRLGDLLKDVEAHPGVVEVRRLGTMVGIQVRPVGDRTGFRVCQAALARGVWIRPLGDTVILMPPLGLEAAETELLVGAVADALDEVYT